MNDNAAAGPRDDIAAPRPPRADPVRAAARRELRALREALPDREERERRLAGHVAAWLTASGLQSIGFYWPTRAEPDLSAAIARWLAQDPARVAALPVIEGPLLRFAPWTADTALVRGAYDIPIPPTPLRIEPQALLIPCVGIDRQRYRLGYGGGYYDRTLAQLAPAPVTVGIAFDCARLDSINPQPHDQRMDLAISESGRW